MVYFHGAKMALRGWSTCKIKYISNPEIHVSQTFRERLLVWYRCTLNISPSFKLWIGIFATFVERFELRFYFRCCVHFITWINWAQFCSSFHIMMIDTLSTHFQSLIKFEIAVLCIQLFETLLDLGIFHSWLSFNS